MGIWREAQVSTGSQFISGDNRTRRSSSVTSRKKVSNIHGRLIHCILKSKRVDNQERIIKIEIENDVSISGCGGSNYRTLSELRLKKNNFKPVLALNCDISVCNIKKTETIDKPLPMSLPITMPRLQLRLNCSCDYKIVTVYLKTRHTAGPRIEKIETP
jgi:hypothetical protein